MKNAPLPSLNALRVFEAAARSASFTRAAKELFVTHGAVSRQVAQLEDALGVALFERRNRRVFLTPAGEELSRVATDALGQISQAVERLRQPPERRPFVVSCERSLAMRWLIPRLRTFQDQYPDIYVHLSTGGGPMDFEGEFLGIAIRRADFPLDPGWDIAEILTEQIGPVCTPALAQTIETRDFVALHTRTRPDAWPRWRELSGQNLHPSEDRTLDHFFLSVQAAASGLGVAIGPFAIVADDLADGRLVAPFGFLPDGSSYVAISQSPFAEDSRKEILISWLRQEATALTPVATPVPLQDT
jgi:DNA-binding transcriptional LysR family regulator